MRSTFTNSFVAFVLAYAMFVPQTAMAQNKDAKLHLVVAGVSKYAPQSGQKNLALAHKDAQDVVAFWQQRGRGTFANVSGDALVDEQAMREKILARFDHVRDTARAGDWVVIFLAGHGGPFSDHDGKDWCFCAHDAPLRGRELRDRIHSLAEKKVFVVLILDACFSGMMATPDTQAIVMAACRGEEFSSEPAILRNGQFTQALLAGLGGQAKTDKGRVTLESLRAYVTQQVARCSDNRQTPLFAAPPGMRDALSFTVQIGPLPNQGNGPSPVSAEKVVRWLKDKGHQAEILAKDQQQGKTVSALIEEDGWRYEVRVHFTTDERGLWFTTPLRPADGLSVQQMQALMKRTSELACMDVFTVDAHGQLCLETPNAHITASAPFGVREIFFQKLSRHLRTIRDSHDEWKTPPATK
jgi:hypothetical protein